MPPQPTGTHHSLPLGNLSPSDFERMCLWLVVREGYERISDYGARGGPDGGRDFEGWREGRRVLFQCKRTKTFRAADAKAEIEKVSALPGAQRPEELCFLLSSDPTPATIDAAKAAWFGEDSNCWFLSGRQLDERIRRYPEIVETFFALAPGSDGDSYSVRIGGDAYQSPIILGGGNTIIYQNDRFHLVNEPYRCQAPHPGSGFVHRGELDIMVERLNASTSDATASSTLAITTALQGAGGFGKTTLAQALCHHPEVREAFPDGTLWVVMGEGLDNAGRIRAILDSVRLWTGTNPPAFESALAAGTYLRGLLSGLRVLVVVDDVWQRGDIRPFEGLGAGSALLITTRNRSTLPRDTQPLDVDEMQLGEAVQLLGVGLDGQPEDLEPLARQLGEWPLLLKLVNGQVRKLTGRGVQVSDALEQVGAKLHKKGLTAFDHRDAEAREDAVRLTMAAGFESGVLDQDEWARYQSLAIFPEDTDIPIEVLAPYWSLSLDAAEDLAERLFDLSLLQSFDSGTPQTIRLHDVFRHYLIDNQLSQLVSLNQRFLDSHRPESDRWADLLPSAGYLWRHLPHHLLGVGEASTLAELLVDPDYLETKIAVTDVNALLADFQEPAADQDRLLLADAIRKSAHCLNQDPRQLASQLLGRIAESERPLFQRLTNSLRGRWGLLPRRGSLMPAGGPLKRTLEGHTLWVQAVEALQNGCIVSASADSTLRVWDIHTGACLDTLEGHTHLVVALERLEGGRIISASYDTTLRVWDVNAGVCLNTLEGHVGWVRAVERLQDGHIVSASDDNTLRVWDPETGACLKTLKGHTDAVLALARLQDGRIVSASADSTLRVWDPETGACLKTLEGHANTVMALARLPDGRIVSASLDATLRVWNVNTGACLNTLEGHISWVRAVELLQGGRIVSGSDDCTLRVWDLASGTCLHILKGHTGRIQAVKSLEEGHVISTSYDNTVRVWDAEVGACLCTLEGHTNRVQAVEPLGDGCIVSASEDSTLRVWDLNAEVGLRTLEGHTAGVLAMAALGDGRIASASADTTLRVWDLDTGADLHKLEGHASWVRAVEPLGDGRIVSASEDTLRVWDVNSGVCLHTLQDHTGWGRAVEPLGDGRIVSASIDNTLRVWDVNSGACLHTLQGHTDWVVAVEPLEDGRIVSASHDNTLRVWNVNSGACLHTLQGHTDWVVAVEPLEDGRIVSASHDNTIRVWDVNSGDCLNSLEGHGAPIIAMERFQDGRIVSTSDDGTVLRILDVDAAACLHTLEGHTGVVQIVEPLGDGRIVSASNDNTIRVWDVQSGATVAVFTGEGPIEAMQVITPNLIVAGDAAGRVHILDLVESE